MNGEQSNNQGYGPMNGEQQNSGDYNQMNGGYQNSGDYNQMNGGYQNNVGYNQMNGGYQNNVGYNQMNGGYQNNVDYNQMNGGYQNNGGFRPMNAGQSYNGGFKPMNAGQSYNGGFKSMNAGYNQGNGPKDNKSLFIVLAVILVGILAILLLFGGKKSGGNNGGGLFGGSNTVKMNETLKMKNSKLDISLKVNSVDKDFEVQESSGNYMSSAEAGKYVRINVTVTNNSSSEAAIGTFVNFLLTDENKKEIVQSQAWLTTVNDLAPTTISAKGSATFNIYFKVEAIDKMLLEVQVPGRIETKDGVTNVYTDDFFIRLY